MSFTNTVNGTREIETWATNDDGTPFVIYHVHTTKQTHLPEDDPNGVVFNPNIVNKDNIRFCENFNVNRRVEDDYDRRVRRIFERMDELGIPVEVIGNR